MGGIGPAGGVRTTQVPPCRACRVRAGGYVCRCWRLLPTYRIRTYLPEIYRLHHLRGRGRSTDKILAATIRTGRRTTVDGEIISIFIDFFHLRPCSPGRRQRWVEKTLLHDFEPTIRKSFELICVSSCVTCGDIITVFDPPSPGGEKKISCRHHSRHYPYQH